MADVMRHLDEFKLLLFITTWMVIAVAVKGVDIQGFSGSGVCSGTGYTFADMEQQVCASMNMNVGSVLIQGLSSCQTGRVYRNGVPNGGCTGTTQVDSGNGLNARCFQNGPFTGADWIDGCKAGRRLQEAETSGSKCTDESVPNGVHYTESLSTGSWILKTPNATDIMSQLLGVDDAEKVSWLKALGSYHVAGTDSFDLIV